MPPFDSEIKVNAQHLKHLFPSAEGESTYFILLAVIKTVSLTDVPQLNCHRCKTRPGKKARIFPHTLCSDFLPILFLCMNPIRTQNTREMNRRIVCLSVCLSVWDRKGGRKENN